MLNALVATAPVAVALVLLLRGTRAHVAALASLAAAAAGLVVTGVPVAPLVRQGPALLGTLTEVALVLLGGLLLAEVGRARGLDAEVAAWAARLAGAPGHLLLLLVLGVTPFAESVTGFGVGVVLAAPVLRQLGHPPARAALLAALGLVAVPWGALGPGTLVAARLTGLDVDALGTASAALSLPVFLVCGASALRLGLGRGALAANAGALVLTAGALWAGIGLANVLLGTALAGAVGSLAGIGVALGLVRLRTGRPLPAARGLRRAGAPYLVLLTLLLAARGAVVLAERGLPGAPGLAGATALLGSPATWLLVTGIAYALRQTAGRPAPGPLLRRWAPVAATTVMFLMVGSLMAVTGGAAELARAADRLGPVYPALVPWLGGLGGFLTGSNVGANAVLASAQAAAAQRVECPVLVLLAVQNVAASLLTMASAPRVALALQAAGARPDEPGVLRTLLAVDAVALTLLSGLALVLCN